MIILLKLVKVAEVVVIIQLMKKVKIQKLYIILNIYCWHMVVVKVVIEIGIQDRILVNPEVVQVGSPYYNDLYKI